MSIKDRLRQLEDKVDRIERATIQRECEAFADAIGDSIYEKCRIRQNDPEIIGNVMRWKGKDYLDADFVPKGCCTGKLIIAANLAEPDQTWIPFKKPDGTDNIEITDALARMRTDEQPIWVMVNALVLGEGFASDSPCKLLAVETNADPIQFICNSVLKNTIAAYKCRLANIDDLKKAGIR